MQTFLFQLKTKERRSCLASPSLHWWERTAPHSQMRAMSSTSTRWPGTRWHEAYTEMTWLYTEPLVLQLTTVSLRFFPLRPCVGLPGQCDENATFSNQGLYLSMPCCKEDFNSCPSLPANLPFQRSPKETFWVSTQLCSTKLTQNGMAKSSLLTPNMFCTALYCTVLYYIILYCTLLYFTVLYSILSGSAGLAELEGPPWQSSGHPGSTTPH